MELGSSSSSTSADSSSDCLKFGKKIYFEDAAGGGGGGSGGSSQPAAVGGGRPPPSPAKRGRSAAAQGGQPPRCQVEGCKADLSEVKAYYSKHKVCGIHSKSPKVIVAGIEQRFCQQCSRFHQLTEFDQVKRSCRRRLAGHNERRRKPLLGSILSTHYGTLSSSMFGNNGENGSFLMDFASYPYPSGKGSWRPSTRVSEQTWDSQTAGSGSFLQQPWQRNSEDPPPKLLLLGSDARATYPGGPSGECFTGGVSDSSTRALSLLSNQPWGSRNQPSGLGVINSLLHTDGTLDVRPSGSYASVINEFSSPWGFKGNHQATISSDKIILPDSHYSGELEMAHQQSGRAYMGLEYSSGYDSSVQNVHWTL